MSIRRSRVLSLLSRSKIRQRIILLFVYNQEKEFYINEIARLVKTSAGTAQRELHKLLENEFVNFNRKGNCVYYRLNVSNPLFDEIKSIVHKTIGLEVILRKEFSKLQEIEYAFIFGSFAQGDFKSSSDIDVYVIGEISEGLLQKHVERVERSIQRDINYHISSRNEFTQKLQKEFFYKEITSRYILIKGKEDAFRKIIERSH